MIPLSLPLHNAISIHFPFHPSLSSLSLTNPNSIFTTKLSLKKQHQQNIQSFQIKACSSSIEIDMVQNSQGIYAPKHNNKVVVLWDLDNKPPRGPPYPAAVSLKNTASFFGEIVDISAYANRHAFIHLPHWVIQERRSRKELDIMERKGVVTPTEPYVCSVCGRKCKTNLDLKKHFKQLHERERQKKLSRMRSLKGKKRQRYKERFISGNHKYNEAARSLLKPKVGYGLASELRRAGVYVKTVEDKPQAADWALKKQMQHSMSRGIDWLVLVSDDSDFSDMLKRAREASLGTVVVGDWDRALGRHADLWVPWIDVENGTVSEMDLMPKKRDGRRSEGFVEEDGLFTVSNFDGDVGVENLDGIMDEFIGMRTKFNDLIIEDDGEEWEEQQDYMSESSDDEYTEDEDGFY
ncbi:unnamed protein product [Lupinus luteus]|uniref:C2H2-type domain-containing protein n=1 Tax=Lupinus luteus TaxID=3873 RepID=A0AAV1XPP7_LUPLU